MNDPIIECVPNFSEGRDPVVLGAIADAIRSVEGAKLLNIDPGASTHRTVFTFAGEPNAVCEAAVRAAKAGVDRIDMRRHQGQHPRFGALDVCPLVPIANISMEETVSLAHSLAQRLGEELGLTVYCYGDAASRPERRDLSMVRSGEYEGLAEKLSRPDGQPDYGPAEFNPASGATAVGARDVLIAYNVNLNTTSVRRANSVAFDVRERGRVQREGGTLTGEVLRDPEGNALYAPGTLKSVRAIGWFIKEYGFAQVSMNLTDRGQTPIHLAFDECVEKAAVRGIRVTGSEIVGLVPLSAMLDAGRYFLRNQRRSLGVPDSELIRVAIKSMGLNELAPFNPAERIIEYAITPANVKLTDLSVRAFAEETASESAAPGGGSISATMGAMGAALATMVANLSSHKRGWDERWEEFSVWAERSKALYVQLLQLVDDDTSAFNRLMDAFGLPKASKEEAATREQEMEAATKQAIEVPLKVMRTALAAMECTHAMADVGNPNSVSDAGVGALALRSAVIGAGLNVVINSKSLNDVQYAQSARAEAEELVARACKREAETTDLVRSKCR